MTDEEITKSLLTACEEKKTTKADAEKWIGLPQNSLASILTGRKAIPLKHRPKMIEYITRGYPKMISAGENSTYIAPNGPPTPMRADSAPLAEVLAHNSKPKVRAQIEAERAGSGEVMPNSNLIEPNEFVEVSLSEGNGNLNSKIDFAPQSLNAFDSPKADFMVNDEFGQWGKVTSKRLSETWIQEIRDYCVKTGCQPDELPGIIEALKIENKRIKGDTLMRSNELRNSTTPHLDSNPNQERSGNNYTPMSPFMLEQQKKARGEK